MISLDGSLFVVFFLVWGLFLLYKKMFFSPLVKVIKEREEFIEKNLKEKENNEKEVERKLSLIEEKLSLAREEAKNIRQNSRDKTMAYYTESIRKASEESKIRVEKVRNEVNALLPELKKQIERDVKEIAELIVEKVLR